MNQYFSRLAQRSAVSPQSSTARSGAASSVAESGWSEQSVEISVPSNATAPGNHGDKEHGKEVHATAKSKTDNTSETSQPSKAVATPTGSAQKIQETGNALTPSVSRAASETSSMDSGFDEHDHAIEQTATKFEASSGPEQTHAPVSTSIKSVSVFSGQLPPAQLAEETETKGQVFHAGAFSAAVTEATSRSPANRNEKSVMATSGFENSLASESNPVQVIRSNPAPPMQAVKSERVMSGPVQAAAAPEQQRRPATSSSIEVNIGKIELEVYAPTPKAAAPVAPMPTNAPRAKPAAVFNPHRHYLRGR